MRNLRWGVYQFGAFLDYHRDANRPLDHLAALDPTEQRTVLGDFRRHLLANRLAPNAKRNVVRYLNRVLHLDGFDDTVRVPQLYTRAISEPQEVRRPTTSVEMSPLRPDDVFSLVEGRIQRWKSGRVHLRALERSWQTFAEFLSVADRCNALRTLLGLEQSAANERVAAFGAQLLDNGYKPTSVRAALGDLSRVVKAARELQMTNLGLVVELPTLKHYWSTYNHELLNGAAYYEPQAASVLGGLLEGMQPQSIANYLYILHSAALELPDQSLRTPPAQRLAAMAAFLMQAPAAEIVAFYQSYRAAADQGHHGATLAKSARLHSAIAHITTEYHRLHHRGDLVELPSAPQFARARVRAEQILRLPDDAVPQAIRDALAIYFANRTDTQLQNAIRTLVLLKRYLGAPNELAAAHQILTLTADDPDKHLSAATSYLAQNVSKATGERYQACLHDLWRAAHP